MDFDNNEHDTPIYNAMFEMDNLENENISHAPLNIEFCDTLDYMGILEALNEQSKSIQQAIDRRREELEVGFIDTLNYLLKSVNMRLDEKITISLTEHGKLIVSDHVRKNVIQYLIERNPQCIKIMQKLAADTLLKRALQSLEKSLSIEQDRGMSEKIIFQTTLKGDLSHFYLIQD